MKKNWATETEQPGSVHCMPTNRWPTVENPLYPYPYTYEYRSTLGTSIIRLVILNFTKHIQVNAWSLLLKFWLIAIFSSLRKAPILTFSGWWYTYPSEKIVVRWDYYSRYMKKYKMFQTTNQFLIAKRLITNTSITRAGSTWPRCLEKHICTARLHTSFFTTSLVTARMINTVFIVSLGVFEVKRSLESKKQRLGLNKIIQYRSI